MTINFYINDEQKFPFCSMPNVSSNPFSLGDKINLSYDVETKGFGIFQKDDNLEILENALKLIYENRGVEIVSEQKHMKYVGNRTVILIIEYYCDIIK